MQSKNAQRAVNANLSMLKETSDHLASTYWSESEAGYLDSARYSWSWHRDHCHPLSKRCWIICWQEKNHEDLLERPSQSSLSLEVMWNPGHANKPKQTARTNSPVCRHQTYRTNKIEIALISQSVRSESLIALFELEAAMDAKTELNSGLPSNPRKCCEELMPAVQKLRHVALLRSPAAVSICHSLATHMAWQVRNHRTIGNQKTKVWVQISFEPATNLQDTGEYVSSVVTYSVFVQSFRAAGRSRLCSPVTGRITSYHDTCWCPTLIPEILRSQSFTQSLGIFLALSIC